MTDRLHLQTRLKLGGGHSETSQPSSFSAGRVSILLLRRDVIVRAPRVLYPFPLPPICHRICKRCGVRLDARDFLLGACAAASRAPKHTPCFLWDQV